MNTLPSHGNHRNFAAWLAGSRTELPAGNSGVPLHEKADVINRLPDLREVPASPPSAVSMSPFGLAAC